MKTLLFLIFFFILNSCTNTISTLIIVSNDSSNEIDSVIVRTNGVKEIFYNVSSIPQERKIYIKSEKNMVGGFTITIYQKDSILNSTSFGYYMNVESIKSLYSVKILKDYTIKEENK
ncbi:MAG: hypothetical protein IPL97_00100 [Niastella sp.]|nr:hypothetical protein [Niastella sp.]